MKTIEVIYARHGETIFNIQNRMQGWTDSPLTERGVKQVHSAAAALQDIRIDRAFVSPLGRARETAAILLAGKETPLVLMEDLREFSYGQMDGMVKPTADPGFQRRFNEDQFDDMSGESREVIQARVRSAFREIEALSCDGETVLAVSHGAYYRQLLRALCGMDIPRDDSARPLIPNAGLALIVLRDGEWKLAIPAAEPSAFLQAWQRWDPSSKAR